MKRRIFSALALLSFLLLAATLMLWVRGYWVGEEIHRLGDHHGQYLSSSRGQFAYFASETVISRKPPGWRYHRYDDPREPHRQSNAIEGRIAARAGNRGFRLAQFAVRRAPTGAIILIAPLWIPAILLTIAPTLWILRRRKRPPVGSCPNCGYDLRATPDRCPECGHAPSTATTR